MSPEAVGGDEDEGSDGVLACGFGEDAGAVYVGGPEVVVGDLLVGEHGGAMEDSVELFFGEEIVDLGGVADVALDGGEVGVRGVGFGYEVDVDDLVAFGEEAAFKDSAEESGGSGDENFLHANLFAGCQDQVRVRSADWKR